MEGIERMCQNCTYYPCLRINCGRVCDNHKFESEEMIEKLRTEGYQDWEGER